MQQLGFIGLSDQKIKIKHMLVIVFVHMYLLISEMKLTITIKTMMPLMRILIMKNKVLY